MEQLISDISVQFKVLRDLTLTTRNDNDQQYLNNVRQKKLLTIDVSDQQALHYRHIVLRNRTHG